MCDRWSDRDTSAIKILQCCNETLFSRDIHMYVGTNILHFKIKHKIDRFSIDRNKELNIIKNYILLQKVENIE